MHDSIPAQAYEIIRQKKVKELKVFQEVHRAVITQYLTLVEEAAKATREANAALLKDPK
jgi:hypothetical protein